MAARKKKAKPSEQVGQPDPRATLDIAAFLAAARPVLAQLTSDLLERGDRSPAVTTALQTRHASERDAQRTADDFTTWRRSFVDQVAAAWLLSCAFVRTLEDRGLLGAARIAGPGASDSQRLYLEMAPSLTERDYLLTIFRELSRIPAAKDLFDERHNPVWLLAPSADAAKSLLQLFRTPDADAPAFRFGQADTRFLGDLYQDLNDDVKKRYALLQTPRFVESFILDRTLERAIERFGLDDTTLIDPTCGSGHFLLGAFDRFVDHRLRAEPGLDVREAARRALDQVFGADINPYAVAIARFRLTLAFLEKAGYQKLDQSPALGLHLVVADSLLHNPHVEQLELGDRAGTSVAAWKGEQFALEDEAAARDVLYRRYAAVVGNPPYITVKDAVLRERYRGMYKRSAAGKYSVAAPFTERFFQLGREGAAVGMITANSFMKREFGKKLIEEYLPTVNLDLVINTSGAFVPGHGTPTVLLFGTSEPRKDSPIHVVLASRGEPSTPEDPEQGLVWRSIADHWSEVGFENEYISVANVEREHLHKHPWSLGGGGASELKELLEERSALRLGDMAESIGISCVTGEDDVYLLPPEAAVRFGVGRTVALVTGEFIRDWALAEAGQCVFPYDPEFALHSPENASAELKYLWPFRTNLSKRKRFGVPMLERGLSWYELQELYADKLRTPLTIAFAFVATHNHFVLDRGGKVFKQSAPIIKLPESATEDDHYALLAYLNSSTACFFLRQVLHSKGGQGVNEGHKAEEWEQFLEFSGTQVAGVPLPPGWSSLAPLGRALSELAAERGRLMPEVIARSATQATTLAKRIESAKDLEHALLARMVAMQERLDFEVYRLFGLLGEVPPIPESLAPGQRAFELQLARSKGYTAWFSRHGYAEPPGDMASYATDQETCEYAIVEQPTFKRRWLLTNWNQRVASAGRALVVDRAEAVIANSIAPDVWRASAFLKDVMERPECRELVPTDSEKLLEQWIAEDAVPYVSALRLTESGLAKRAAWLSTWESQRLEDSGKANGEVSVPPRYDRKDYQSLGGWTLRGKLDVPKERFISYPGCESDEDHEPVYGWAGWDHAQRARALGTLYFKRKTEEGWPKERLTPMLAGLLELLPWLHQWHSEPNEDYGGQSPAQYFDDFLNAQCSELGLSQDDLRAWRPPERKHAPGKPRKKPPERIEDVE